METFGNVEIERIPEDKIFVMGDNRGKSLDSRDKRIGLVNTEDVVRKAVIRFYPFSKLGLINK